jgi:outer membrane biogenesis lipoprotein LolB
MRGEINVTNPDKPKKDLIVITNPATSTTLTTFRDHEVLKNALRTSGQQQYSGTEVARLVVEALGMQPR